MRLLGPWAPVSSLTVPILSVSVPALVSTQYSQAIMNTAICECRLPTNVHSGQAMLLIRHVEINLMGTMEWICATIYCRELFQSLRSFLQLLQRMLSNYHDRGKKGMTMPSGKVEICTCSSSLVRSNVLNSKHIIQIKEIKSHIA